MSLFKQLTPVIIAEAVEPGIAFWTDRLGFAITNQVPGPDGKLIFASAEKDGVEVMYQTHESVEKDAPGLVPRSHGIATALFIEVSDIESIERAIAGLEIVVPRRQTFYGMDEIGVREPGGHVVMFAQPTG